MGVLKPSIWVQTDIGFGCVWGVPALLLVVPVGNLHVHGPRRIVDSADSDGAVGSGGHTPEKQVTEVDFSKLCAPEVADPPIERMVVIFEGLSKGRVAMRNREKNLIPIRGLEH